jgi:hypothetical protein
MVVAPWQLMYAIQLMEKRVNGESRKFAGGAGGGARRRSVSVALHDGAALGAEKVTCCAWKAVPASAHPGSWQKRSKKGIS